MKHAGEAALGAIESILIALRRMEGIRERKLGVFYRKSSAFIHFHEDPVGIFVDLREDEAWIRLPVNTSLERRQFLRLVNQILGAK
ncbi:MAG: hypothetical protein WB524_00235 [Acidobacteriaceae bacterium]|jgi:hypothetical protein